MRREEAGARPCAPPLMLPIHSCVCSGTAQPPARLCSPPLESKCIHQQQSVPPVHSTRGEAFWCFTPPTDHGRALSRGPRDGVITAHVSKS